MKETIRVVINKPAIAPAAVGAAPPFANAQVRIGILEMAKAGPNGELVPGVVGLIFEDGEGGTCVVAVKPEALPLLIGPLAACGALSTDQLPPVFSVAEAQILADKVDHWKPRIITGGRL